MIKNILISLFVLSTFVLIGYFYVNEGKNFISHQFNSEDLVMNSSDSERICDIRDFGAKEDVDIKSTNAINEAINFCYDQGGGTVLIPEGEWFSGGIRLKSNINLFLAEGSLISFSTDLKDYLPVVFTRFQGIEFYNYAPLIYARDGHNISITGTGKLIGNGDRRDDWTGGGNFEKARMKLFEASQNNVPVEERIFGDKEPGLRPSFIQFVNCKDITLDGFSIENGPIWTIHPVYSENFIARNLKIDTWSGNTDGIVIDSTKNVLIEDSYFSTGDDAIAIKSGLDEEGRKVAKPSENIRIRNIIVVKGSSGVSIGSEMSGGVRNVDIRDSIFTKTRHGFRIKSTRTRGGFIDNIMVENVTINESSGDAIDINLAYSSSLQSEVSNKPIIKNVYIKNIIGTQNKRLGINIDGTSNVNMENVNMENIFFTESERSVSFKKSKNVTLKNIKIESREEPAFEIEDSQNISIIDSQCQSKSSRCALFSGIKTSDIFLSNLGSVIDQGDVEIVDGARRENIIIENTQ